MLLHNPTIYIELFGRDEFMEMVTTMELYLKRVEDDLQQLKNYLLELHNRRDRIIETYINTIARLEKIL